MLTRVEFLELFPTVVTVSKIDITEKEKELLRNQKRLPNTGNQKSENNYILEMPELSRIKKDIEQAFEDYMYRIKLTVNDVSARVTQSWLNWTNEGNHHLHNHPNSYLSAVLYIDAHEDDSIIFVKNTWEDSHIYLHTDRLTRHNGNAWKYPAKENHLVVFPSHLFHKVEDREKKDITRLSLACNMIPKGKIGNPETLDEVEL